MKKMIKGIALFLVVTLVFSFTTVFAATGSDAEPDKLSIEEVIQNVDDQISTYVESDFQGKGRGIKADDNVIPLYDLEESIVAYIVPLYNASGSEVGYMITSAFENGSLMCELSLDNVLVSDLQNILSEDDKLTYLSLMNFGIKVNKGTDDGLFYQINKGNIKAFARNNNKNTDSTSSGPKGLDSASSNIIEIDSEKVAKFTEHVKSSRTSRLLKASESNSINLTSINLDTVDVNFWGLITNPSNTYYGGNQMWWTDGRENYGCGPVAAANIAAYYDKYNGLTNLYAPSYRSQSDFEQTKPRW